MKKIPWLIVAPLLIGAVAILGMRLHVGHGILSEQKPESLIIENQTWASSPAFAQKHSSVATTMGTAPGSAETEKPEKCDTKSYGEGGWVLSSSNGYEQQVFTCQKGFVKYDAKATKDSNEDMAKYEKSKDDLVFALQTRVATDKEMSMAKQLGYQLLTHPMVPYMEEDKRREFQDLMLSQYQLREATPKKTEIKGTLIEPPATGPVVFPTPEPSTEPVNPSPGLIACWLNNDHVVVCKDSDGKPWGVRP